MEGRIKKGICFAAVLSISTSLVSVSPAEEMVPEIKAAGMEETVPETFFYEEALEELSRENISDEEQGFWIKYAPESWLWLPDSWSALPLSDEFTDPYVIFQAYDHTFSYCVEIMQLDFKEMQSMINPFAEEDFFAEDSLETEEEAEAADATIETEETATLEDLLGAFMQQYSDVKQITCNGRGAIAANYEDLDNPAASYVGILMLSDDMETAFILQVTPGSGEEFKAAAFDIMNSFGSVILEEELLAGEKEDRSEEIPISAITCMGMPPYGVNQEIRFTYDEKGNLLTESTYSQDQVLLTEVRRTYDENNYVLTRSQWMQEAATEFAYENTYDKGKLVKQVEFSEDQILGITTYQWENDRLLYDRTEDENGNLLGTSDYVYDTEGRLIRITRRDALGHLANSVEYRYDSYHRIKLQIDYMDEEAMSCTSYSYS